MPGSRQGFCVNIGFSDEDRILIENLHVFKGYGVKKVIKKFLNKGWGLQQLNKRLKKLPEKLLRRQDEAAAFDHELLGGRQH